MYRIVLSILLLSVSLSGCGFRPVYGKMNDTLGNKLERVQVSDIGGRNGQVLKAKLEDLLDPVHQKLPPDYKISVQIKIEERELGIEEDLRVTRYDVVMTADYHLVSLTEGREVDAGNATIKSSYNRTQSEFSTFVAQQDAQEKAAEELAQELRSRLIYYFSK